MLSTNREPSKSVINPWKTSCPTGSLVFLECKLQCIIQEHKITPFQHKMCRDSLRAISTEQFYLEKRKQGWITLACLKHDRSLLFAFTRQFMKWGMVVVVVGTSPHEQISANDTYTKCFNIK